MMVCEVRLMCILLSFIFNGAQCSVIFSNKHKPPGVFVARLPEPLLQISHVIKKTLRNKSTNEITKLMKDHLITMKLINKNNIWASGKLETIGHTLLPKNLDGLDLCDLVDKMAQHAAKNPYLVDFLTQATETTYSQLQGLVQSEGDRTLPDVIAFAMVLERLTSSQKEDWKVMQSCHEIWDRELSKEDVRSVTTPFEAAKALTIGKIMDKWLMMLERGRIGLEDAPVFPVGLPVNILEAMLEDLRREYLANAKVGWTLTKNSVTGQGPARISDDGQAIEMHLPLGKEWTDLYVTWNLAFVSHFPKFPYFFAKLLIPSVADYQAAPELFLHSRVLALHNFINFGLLTLHDASKNVSDWNWFTREVTQNWGEQNLESSQDYELRLKNERRQQTLYGMVSHALSKHF